MYLFVIIVSRGEKRKKYAPVVVVKKLQAINVGYYTKKKKMIISESPLITLYDKHIPPPSRCIPHIDIQCR